MRIVSLLPSATETVCLLGLEDSLVGVSHECDFPPWRRATGPPVSGRLAEPGSPVLATGPPRVALSWSGGKDSCMALAELQREGRYAVAGLLTMVTREYDRVSMHGVRRQLLERQAESLGYPLHPVFLSRGADNAEYEDRMKEALARLGESGVTAVAFGDLFLQDVRAYRERLVAEAGFQAVFPIWGRETGSLARTFIEAGYRAIVTCVDPRVLDPSFAGHMIDGDFLRRLPPEVDPCGENGEFHSFVVDGPIFRAPVGCEVGKTVVRDSFCFCDLVPA